MTNEFGSELGSSMNSLHAYNSYSNRVESTMSSTNETSRIYSGYSGNYYGSTGQMYSPLQPPTMPMWQSQQSQTDILPHSHSSAAPTFHGASHLLPMAHVNQFGQMSQLSPMPLAQLQPTYPSPMGYDTGYDVGYDAGYDTGYDAGYDAYSPMNSMNQLNGLNGMGNANIMAHSSMFGISPGSSSSSASVSLDSHDAVSLSAPAQGDLYSTGLSNASLLMGGNLRHLNPLWGPAQVSTPVSNIPSGAGDGNLGIPYGGGMATHFTYNTGTTSSQQHL